MVGRVALCLGAVLVSFAKVAEGVERPNILLVMADDLGFSDLGCYGGEIDTPVLDGLAEHGLRYTQFYNTARCWPTRAALLTGYYAQQVRRDVLPGLSKKAGNRGVRPNWAPLLPAMLKEAGYRTYHSGKWHIDSVPLNAGFDRSYTLWRQGNFFRPKRHEIDGQSLPRPTAGDGYYGTTAIADYTVEILRDHQTNHGDAPFFAYVAFTAPHFPLHALPEDIAKYEGRYDDGWEVIREQRYFKQKQMGLLDGKLSEVERDLGPPYDFPDAIRQLGPGETNRPQEWHSLTDEQREFQAKKMEVHAAMVDRMDAELGRIIDQIESMGQSDNTLVIFLSDNGASAEIMVRDDGHDPSLPLGSDLTYPCLGPGWSTTCNTPFRRHKTWVHEGGCATPLIVSWPDEVSDHGGFRRVPGHVVDIVPSLLAAAQLESPSLGGPARPGRTLAPTIYADVDVERDSIWWMHDGHRAYRVGDWKVVSVKGEPWELYNLVTDRTETDNLATKRPAKLKELVTAWENEWNGIQATAAGPGWGEVE